MLALIVVALAADPTEAAWPLEEAEVVVAQRALFRGQVVTAADLTTTKMRAHQVPAGAVSDPGEAVGRVLQAPVYEGSLLYRARFADPEQGPGVEALLPSGYRLFTYVLPTPDLSYRTGNRVDVVDVTAGCALAERVEVVAVRRRGERTVDVADPHPAEALELALPAEVIPRFAQPDGLALLLRSPIDLEASGLPACASVP